ncbi:efflux RND transporter periplasmic adaptor subunit [Hyphomicrobium sp.]|jgi:cobalt-zinc-cadmium efflux system membrane fusion protein|uniref:efflux RND transporter periplasmic adaptor subunit n=1 Tax=Hyphomicrobium sp. TaxID=82 RepID=UPI002FE32A70
MPPDRIDASKITLVPVEAGTLNRRLSVPGVLMPDRNRVGRVAAKVIGTVAELKKQLGEPVEKGEVIAILESREVADAKSEFIAANVNLELQSTLYEREQSLWEKQVTAEQRLIRARATQREAQVRTELARQKLTALGVNESEIVALTSVGKQPTGLERYEIRAPIAGRIVEQLVDLGTPVGGEGQAKELYAIADLSMLWVELTVSTTDLSQIREGQLLTISTSVEGQQSSGKIVFTSPLIDQDTRSARVTASVDNSQGHLRPGTFVTANIAVEQRKAALVVPKVALQTIEGKPTAFVRTSHGFQARPVIVGEDDGQFVEISSGLNSGDLIAASNTFLLKADVGKSEAGHAH